MRAGGRLKTRNPASAPASASPTVVASPPRIANAGRGHQARRRPRGRRGRRAGSPRSAGRRRAPRCATATERRRRGRRARPATPTTISAPRRARGVRSRASSSDPEREGEGVREEQRRADPPRSARRAGRGTPRRRRGTAPGARAPSAGPGGRRCRAGSRRAGRSGAATSVDDERDDEFHTSTSDDVPCVHLDAARARANPQRLVEPQRGGVVRARDDLDRGRRRAGELGGGRVDHELVPMPRPPRRSSTATARISAARQVVAARRAGYRSVSSTRRHDRSESRRGARRPATRPSRSDERRGRASPTSSVRRGEARRRGRRSSSVATSANDVGDRDDPAVQPVEERAARASARKPSVIRVGVQLRRAAGVGVAGEPNDHAVTAGRVPRSRS